MRFQYNNDHTSFHMYYFFYVGIVRLRHDKQKFELSFYYYFNIFARIYSRRIFYEVQPHFVYSPCITVDIGSECRVNCSEYGEKKKQIKFVIIANV